MRAIELQEQCRSIVIVARRLEKMLGEVTASEATEAYTALSVGKAMAKAIAELAKGHLAAFRENESIPVGFAGSLAALPECAASISQELARGPSELLQQRILYYLNCKHLIDLFVVFGFWIIFV
jgi:hypothetical protein